MGRCAAIMQHAAFALVSGPVLCYAQLAQQLVDVYDLVNGIRLHGLLTIPQGGVRDPDLLRHGHGHPAVVERHLGNGAVGIHIPLQIRFRHILKGVFVGFLLQQVGLTGNL